MSAEVLREAARLMRERAAGATAFTDAKTGSPLAWIQGLDGWVFDHGAAQIACAMTSENSEHIASWHPAVALAVADWLDAVSEFNPSPTSPALAVARAYLGSDQ